MTRGEFDRDVMPKLSDLWTRWTVTDDQRDALFRATSGLPAQAVLVAAAEIWADHAEAFQPPMKVLIAEARRRRGTDEVKSDDRRRLEAEFDRPATDDELRSHPCARKLRQLRMLRAGAMKAALFAESDEERVRAREAQRDAEKQLGRIESAWPQERIDAVNAIADGLASERAARRGLRLALPQQERAT